MARQASVHSYIHNPLQIINSKQAENNKVTPYTCYLSATVTKTYPKCNATTLSADDVYTCQHMYNAKCV